MDNQEQEIMQEGKAPLFSKPNRYVLLAGVFVIALVAIVGVNFFQYAPAEYVIKGVPYTGKQNHIGEFAYLRNDADAALFSILEYWKPGQYDALRVTDYFDFSKAVRQQDYIDIIGIIGSFDIRKEELEITELSRYVNEKEQTPLLFFMPITADQPDTIKYYPATILIGLDERRKIVTVHNYWIGSNYEISFEEFSKRQLRLPRAFRNQYIVITPKDKDIFNVVRNRSTSEYEERGTVLRESEEMLQLFALGVGAQYYQEKELAGALFEQVVNSDKFQTFLPPFFKTYALYQVGEARLAKDNPEEAREFIDKAIGLNHGFNEPFKDWPGYEVRSNLTEVIDRISGPYRVLGDIYMQQGDRENALKAYDQALAIYPSNEFISIEELK